MIGSSVAQPDTGNTPPKTTKARRMVCAGCCEEAAHLFEVLDSLTYFPGDLVCRACADNSGSETV